MSLPAPPPTTHHPPPPNKMPNTKTQAKKAQKQAKKKADAEALLNVVVEEPTVEEPTVEDTPDEWDDATIVDLKAENEKLLTTVAELKAQLTTKTPTETLTGLMKPQNNPYLLMQAIMAIDGCAKLDLVKCFESPVWHYEMINLAFSALGMSMDIIRENHVNMTKFLGSKTIVTCDVGVGTENKSPPASVMSVMPVVSAKPASTKVKTVSFAEVIVNTVPIGSADSASTPESHWVKVAKRPVRPASTPATGSQVECKPCKKPVKSVVWQNTQLCKYADESGCKNPDCAFIHIGQQFYVPDKTRTKWCTYADKCTREVCDFAHPETGLRTNGTYKCAGTVLPDWTIKGDDGKLYYVSDSDGKMYGMDDHQLYKVN